MIQTLITLVIYIVVIGLLFWLVHWVLSQVPLPEPFAMIARVVLAIAAFLIVAYLLLGLVPGGHALRLGLTAFSHLA